MAVTLLKEKYTNAINQVTLGATAAEGGTRTSTVTVGGEATLPFLPMEGAMPNKPAIAMEMWDVVPAWNDCFQEFYGDVWNDPAAWAKKVVEYGADLIYLKLMGASPDADNPKSAADCVQTVKAVLGAVGVPLIVVGPGSPEKDNEVLEAVAEACAGENLAIGVAEQANYKSLVAACMVHKHSIIAGTPMDINICKQLNIQITEMGLAPDRIIIDLLTSGLGYGIEYAYSVMERARNGALFGDKMLSMPIICTVGSEAWRAKEANAPETDFPGWGDQKIRGPLWEAMTAAVLLQAGGSILLMRHPEAVKLVKDHINDLMA